MTRSASLIIDAHCHAWRSWPYRPAPGGGQLPEWSHQTLANASIPHDYGNVEALLAEMDLNGVDQALIVSASIDAEGHNNRYVADAVAMAAGRLHQLVDIDSMWSTDYGRSGAATRLRSHLEQHEAVGFTHYQSARSSGEWLTSTDAAELFQCAQGLGLMASLHVLPHQLRHLASAARRFPGVPVLLHHFAHVDATEQSSVDALLALSAIENVYVKFSGLHYLGGGHERWDFPYRGTHHVIEAVHDTFGPERMCWGSDFPVSRRDLTYRQALDLVGSQCDFITSDGKAAILGGTIARLLAATRQGASSARASHPLSHPAKKEQT